MRSFTRSLCVVAVLTLAVAHAAPAAVVVATNAEQAPAPGQPSFTPSYLVSSSDLLNGMLPANAPGVFDLEFGGGLPALTDGTYGTITEPGGAPDRQHPAFATVGGGSGTGSFIVYELDTAAAPLGYDITRIDLYGGWNDNGRDQQLVAVGYTTLASGGTFIDLATANFNPTVPADTQSATRVSVVETTPAPLATGVTRLLFQFDPTGQPENGYVGYAEIDVIGSPTVPEPGTVGMLCAAAGLLVRRRRR